MANLLIALVLAAVTAQPADTAGALRDAARLQAAGDSAGALDSYARAAALSGDGTTERAQALLGLAGVKLDLGKYSEAARHAKDAATIFQTRGDTASVATALNRTGLAALYAADYAQAEQGFQAAIALSRRAGRNEPLAEQLANLGNVYFFVGRYAEAAANYDASLAIVAAGGDAPWTAPQRRLVLVNQAALYQRLGRDEQALGIYKSLGASHVGLRPAEQAQMLVNLGVLYRRLGDPIKALETYDAARELFNRDRHVDGELGVLNNRGIVLALDLHRLDEAEATFTEALDTAESVGNRRAMLHAHVYRGETALRAGHRDRAQGDFEDALALARELKTPEEEWKALYGLGRVAPAQSDAVRYLERAVSTIEQIREAVRVPNLRVDFLNDKREVYDALLAARFDTASPEALFDLLERSHSRGWRERLKLPGSVDLRVVQGALPPRTLLLDYWNAAGGSAVLAITGTRAQAMRITVDREAVSGLLTALERGPSEDWRAFASRLSPMLPPVEWFEGIDHVVVVPDGVTALVPVDLLQLDRRLVIERAAVSYTPTAATLLRPAPGRGRRPPWAVQFRGFGDPAFASATLDDASEVLGRIQASGEEVRLAASELAGRAVLHTGADDLKSHLLSAEERAPIVHVATHAFADANAMEQSRILFSSHDGGPGPADYLFLKEAYDLPLGGVELAVLSACDTERGRALRAEGVQSFSRAFLAAGARSTVTTLWRVADQPTADLMRTFYHGLQRGDSRDEALRRAKLRFLAGGASLANPHYWAAFVMSGDGVAPVPRAVAWSTIVAIALVLPAAIAGVIAIVRRRRILPAYSQT